MLWLLPATMPPVQDALTPPPVRREFRGVWVATVDNIDWPSKRTLGTRQQKDELLAILNRCQAMRLNAVVFQIRPSADALYPSKLEPWSEYLTNRQGKAPNPAWDPLAFAIQEAHKRGLELHVWFNPYRANHPAQKGPVAANHLSKTNPTIVKQYGRYLWMDPGEPLVQKRTLDVIKDVVRRYDIDGVHIDDYFYPYPEGGQDFPDQASYAAYQRRGGLLNKKDWRRQNVDRMVKAIYDGIKAEKKHVKFGISPFGIYRPGVPAGIQAGIDQYDQLYADAQKWLNEGWCDYFTPQLYWPIAQKPQSYPVLLDYWLSQNTKKRHIWPGNYTSRTNPTGGNWKPQEVIDQIKITRDKGANGNVHFSMKAFSQNWNGVFDALRGGPYGDGAVPPPSPWIDTVPPTAPNLKVDGGVVEWEPTGSDPARWFVVWRRYGTKWVTEVFPPAQLKLMTVTRFDTGETMNAVGVAAVDRNGNQSPIRWWRRN